VLEGNVFELTGAPPADATVHHSSYFPTAVTLIGNEFRWAGSDAAPRLETAGPVLPAGGTFERTLRGNIYRDATLSPLVRPTEP